MNSTTKLATNLNGKRVGKGWKAKCLFPERHKNGDANPSMSIFEHKEGGPMLKCQAGCSTSAELMEEARKRGLLPDDGDRKTAVERKIVARYNYTDRKGTLLFQVVRYKPKDFRQRRPDGKGGWKWSVPPELRTLYRLPEVHAANSSRRIYIVEGEKDANALRKLGLVATCNPMGAGKWEQKYSKILRGKRVAIIGDNDPAGQAHAQRVAEELNQAGIKVRVIFSPEPYKDPAEWIAAGATASPSGA